MISRFIAKRLLIALLQLVGLALAVFFLIRALNADPVARLVGLNASPEAYKQSAQALGVDRPIFEQLAAFLGLIEGKPGLLQGSFGVSWVTNDSVMKELASTLPVTIEIVTFSLLASFLLALPLGLASARKPGGTADRISKFWGLFAGAQPDYWWGLLFVFIFYFLLNVAPPPMGRIDALLTEPRSITGFITVDAILYGRVDVLLSAVHHLMLPVITLVFVASGAILKMVRTNTLRALQ